MPTYMKKVWGFTEPAGPLAFGMSTYRDAAQAKLKEGDWVVLVATMGDEPKEKNRGRVLAILEMTREPVSTLDFPVKKELRDVDESGNYRWPFALHVRRAWRTLDRPRLAEISQRAFHINAAAGIVDLTEEEAAKIRSLRREEVPLLEPSAAAAKKLGSSKLKKISPPPAEAVRYVMKMRHAPAYTYVFRVELPGQAAFKIGWTFDFERRMRLFNQASLPSLGGLNYSGHRHHLWGSAKQAYQMEQKLLKLFDSKRHSHNHEIVTGVSEQELEEAWMKLLIASL